MVIGFYGVVEGVVFVVYCVVVDIYGVVVLGVDEQGVVVVLFGVVVVYYYGVVIVCEIVYEGIEIGDCVVGVDVQGVGVGVVYYQIGVVLLQCSGVVYGYCVIGVGE